MPNCGIFVFIATLLEIDSLRIHQLSITCLMMTPLSIGIVRIDTASSSDRRGLLPSCSAAAPMIGDNLKDRTSGMSALRQTFRGAELLVLAVLGRRAVN
jgi:hypothetical protein